MSTEFYPGSERADRLDALLADYLQNVEDGRPPNRELILAQHPDLAGELRAFFANHDFLRSKANRIKPIAPESLGEDYQLLEEIGSGTFGVVVKARNHKFDKLVAIKLLRGEQWSSSEFVRQFRTEARRHGKLDHPHIVPVYHFGEHEGQHYLEMKLIEGGSLVEHLRRRDAERSTRRHQRWAAGLMATVARAVHHAHQYGIVHRDLKPGNILLDADGQPHITDFGLAKQLEEDEQLFELGEAGDSSPRRERYSWEGGPEADTIVTQQGLIVGTAPYMSPQQAAGQEATTASDVYSLGVILYEMLTGQTPIRGTTPQETVELIRQQAPPRLRSLNPQIDPRLERICLKCLQKDPQDRYGSALGLARDLERWLANKPISGPPADPLPTHCWLWCRRNPALALLLASAAALSLIVSVMAVSVSRARAETLEQDVLNSNAYAAQFAAQAMLGQFQEWARAVYDASEHDEFRRYLGQGDKDGLKQFLERTLRGTSGSQFESWIVLNGQGRCVAGSHSSEDTGRFDFRDYFRGACRQADKPRVDSVYVSRAYRSSFLDHKYKIGVSRALRNERQPDDPWVIDATITTDTTVGRLQLQGERHKAALVVPKDPNPDASDLRADPPDEYLIMVHADYGHGVDPVPVPKETLGPLLPKPSSAKQLSLPEPDAAPAGMNARYFDPVTHDGPWLAASAPVGNTGMAVIVQTRRDDAVAHGRPYVWGTVATVIGFLVAVLLGWVVLQFLTRSPE